MILLPTPDEALMFGHGPPLNQGEACRLFAELEPAAVSSDTRLLPFTVWAAWFFRWTKGRMSTVTEPVLYQLLKKLKDSGLPKVLDSQVENWDDNRRPLVGFDIVFIDGARVTWTGIDVFMGLQTLQFTDFVSPPPLEKLGLDAAILFQRGMKRVLTSRETKDGDPRDTGEARAGGQGQGSPGGP
jgi:hypothetical protein